MMETDTTYLVHVCFGPNCTPAGSRALLRVLEAEVTALGIAERVTILPSTCRNRCDFGPSINVSPGNVYYNHVDAEAARRIAREHLAGGVVVRDYLFRPASAPPSHGRRAFTFDPAAFRPDRE